jgi:multidrug efflux pump subunit AcrA (membrane-fusion protein)
VLVVKRRRNPIPLQDVGILLASGAVLGALAYWWYSNNQDQGAASAPVLAGSGGTTGTVVGPGVVEFQNQNQPLGPAAGEG